MSDEPFFLKEEKEKLGLQRANAQTEATLEPLMLGKRVKEIRLSQNLTLEEASKRTGLARSTLQAR